MSSGSNTTQAADGQASNTSYVAPIPRTPGAVAGPSAMRKPANPSPLSQMVAPGQQPEHHPPSALHPPSTKKVQLSIDDDEDHAPYFIHSGLDKHGALQGLVRSKNEKPRDRGREPIAVVHQAHPKRRPGAPRPLTPAHPELVKPVSPPLLDPDNGGGSLLSRLDGSAIDDIDSMDGLYEDDDEEEDDGHHALSRQLAETAQGVREVNKQLGRTRVHSRIQSVLIVTKARDNRLIALTRELAMHLMLRKPAIPASAASSTTDVRSAARSSNDRGMIVYVDAQLRHSKRFDANGLQEDYPQFFEPVNRRRSMSSSSATPQSMSSSWSSAGGNGNGNVSKKEEGQLRYWTADMCSESPQLFDFVVTLGGDGTVLFTSWLFQRIVPPVLPFALGSLGFLTNFDFANYRKTIDKAIDEGIRVNLRMRFTCTVYRAIAPDNTVVIGRHGKRKAIRRPGGEILVNAVDQDGWEALEGGAPIGGCADPADMKGSEKEILCFSTRPVEQFEVLNDLVVDRGPSPFVSFLEVFGDDHHLTTVQADGLTVSTPTGSTAYSLSAGGSLVHPGIPAMLMTPICPHTLSFRPMLLPDGIELRVCVPYNSRSTAWASFDGRGRVELKQGDHIKITASKYPFPTVCADKQSTDWFNSIQRTLKWNERERQKSFVVVEEDYPNDKQQYNNSTSDEYSDNSSDEFDIDDRSTGDLTPPSDGSGSKGDAVPEHNVYDAHGAPSPPIMSARKMRHLVEEYRSGVQSPDRFASNYHAPPPISQRHLLDALTNVEKQLARVDLNERQAEAAAEAEKEDFVFPLPEPDDMRRNESDATLAPDFPRPSRRDSEERYGGRTPRQGRSRSRSAVRSGSRSNSPQVGLKPKAFAFFGHDDSQSEMSDGDDQ